MLEGIGENAVCTQNRSDATELDVIIDQLGALANDYESMLARHTSLVQRLQGPSSEECEAIKEPPSTTILDQLKVLVERLQKAEAGMRDEAHRLEIII